MPASKVCNASVQLHWENGSSMSAAHLDYAAALSSYLDKARVMCILRGCVLPIKVSAARFAAIDEHEEKEKSKGEEEEKATDAAAATAPFSSAAAAAAAAVVDAEAAAEAEARNKIECDVVIHVCVLCPGEATATDGSSSSSSSGDSGLSSVVVYDGKSVFSVHTSAIVVNVEDAAMECLNEFKGDVTIALSVLQARRKATLLATKWDFPDVVTFLRVFIASLVPDVPYEVTVQVVTRTPRARPTRARPFLDARSAVCLHVP